MTFGLNFKNMFNMNTMMNLGSMVGLGGFGGFGGFGGCSTGLSSFGSVFNFYNTSSGCCTPNYSTRNNAKSNGWGPMGLMLGYYGAIIGGPLLFKGTKALCNTIKESTNKSKQAEAQTKVDDITDKLNADYEKLGVSTYEAAKSYTIEKDPTYKKLDELRTDLAPMESTELHAKKDALARAESAYNANSSNTDLKEACDKAQKELDNLKADIKAKNAEVEKAEKAKDARETEIDEIKANIDVLYAQREKEQEVLDDLKLEKADGNVFTRSTAKSFNKVYDIENKEFKQGKDGDNISKGDFQYLIGQYSSAGTTETKKKYAEAIVELLNNDAVSVNAKKSANGIKYIIQKDFPELFTQQT